jgi:hypothetical protein
MKLSVSLRFSRSLRQSVGFLGRVISSLQTQKNAHTHTHTHTLNIHALSGIRTHDPGFRASEESACLRPLGYRDRPTGRTLPLRTFSSTALWTLPYFQFLDLYTVGRTPWTGDQLVARPLPTHRIRDSNPRSKCSRGRRQFMPYTARPLWSTLAFDISIRNSLLIAIASQY